jgi:hypothetical protein
MKVFAAFVLATFCAATAGAQAPAPSETTNSQASVSGGTVVNATLNSSVDSKKAKPGEQVTARTTESVKSTDGRTVLPSGTKLIGHVTQASARSGQEGEATLAIQFDKAVLKDKQEVPLTAVIQAVAPPSQQASSYGSDTERTIAPGSPSSGTNSPNMSGGGRSTRSESTTPTTQSYPSGNPDGTSGGESNSAGPLPANTRGVYGLQGVRLNTNGNAGATVLTSTGKNVHLDGGTRLLLAVQPQNANGAPGGR